MPASGVQDRSAAGARAESAALDYLLQQGLTLVDQNYRCRAGELDLVMKDGSSLVIVEVRFRSATAFAGAAQSVDLRKQQRLIGATRHFLGTHPEAGDMSVRFDVVALDAGVDPRQLRINWIRNAFEA